MFRLKLPKSWKVHPVFYAEKLRKDPGNPLIGQANTEPPPIVLRDSDNEQAEYEVQSIMAVKLARGKLRYRVSWKGWDEDPE